MVTEPKAILVYINITYNIHIFTSNQLLLPYQH